MRKLFLCLPIMTALIVSGCVFSGRRPPSGEPGRTTWLGKQAYWLSVSGPGKEISDEAEAIATDYCREQDKDFKFILNRFRNEADLFGGEKVICDLYFDCEGKGEIATASRAKKKPKKQAPPPAAPSPIPVEVAPEPEPESAAAPKEDVPVAEEPYRVPETAIATSPKKKQTIKIVSPTPTDESGGPFPEGGLGAPESLGFDQAEHGKAKVPSSFPPVIEEMITE